MPKITITVNDAQMRIVDHFATTMGMSRAEAAKHFMLKDAFDWFAKVMNKPVPVRRIERRPFEIEASE